MSRLSAVRRVRELLESRRLAELADAERAASRAIDARRQARAAREQQGVAGGRRSLDQLAADRAAMLAALDLVTDADRQVDDADRAVATARQRFTEAAIERRSVERIESRRAAEQARAAARRADRQLDDLAIIRWGRS